MIYMKIKEQSSANVYFYERAGFLIPNLLKVIYVKGGDGSVAFFLWSGLVVCAD